MHVIVPRATETMYVPVDLLLILLKGYNYFLTNCKVAVKYTFRRKIDRSTGHVDEACRVYTIVAAYWSQ